MKAIIILLLSVVSTVVSAQENTPKFTQNGDRVEVVYYHSNGEISQKGFFKDKKLSGLWMMYDQQGEKIAQGYYADGKKTGKWFIWEDGQLNEVDYVDNKIVHHIRWDMKEAMVDNN